MSTTRRAFIRKTSAAGLLIALPGCTTTEKAARPSVKPVHSLRRRRPDEDIRVAVIGVRGRGWNHVQAFERLDHVEVVAICDCDRSILERRAGEFEKAHERDVDAIIDYRSLLERNDIDVISIATPNHWHALMTMEACIAGKDVYVEKPVSHDIGEGERMLEFVAASGRIVQTGTQSRSCPAIREGIAWMHDGNIGRMELARGLCYKPRKSIGKVPHAQPIPESIDYNLWVGPTPMHPLMRRNLHYDWHWDFKTGNGDIGNQGIHQMDICRWAARAGIMPDRVISIGGRLGYDDDGNTPNTQVVFHDYGTLPILFEVRGLPRDLASQESNWNGNMDTYMGQRIASIIHCEGGALVVPTGSRDCWAVDLDGKQIKSWSGSADHFANFIDTVRTRDTSGLNASILQGVRSSDLCHLGNISHHLGTPGNADAALDAASGNDDFRESFERMHAHLQANGIDVEADVLTIGPALDINPVNNRFVNSKAANDLLSSEGRPPFSYPSFS